MYIRVTRKSGSRIDVDVSVVLRDHYIVMTLTDDLVIESWDWGREEKVEIKLHFDNYREALEFMEKLRRVVDDLINLYLWILQDDFEELETIGQFWVSIEHDLYCHEHGIKECDLGNLEQIEYEMSFIR